MNITNYFWYFQSAIPPRICDLIVKYGKSEKEREIMAITGGFGRDRDLKKQPLNKDEIKNLQKKRDSNIVWMNDKWIYKEIQPYVRIANKSAGWNYDWHCDSWDKPYMEDGPINGKIRKLSVTVTLTDPKEYKGGELEFDFRNQDPDKKPNIRTCTEILPKGSLVVFPSFVWHRVKPVTKGVRHSLVIWNCGYPYK